MLLPRPPRVPVRQRVAAFARHPATRATGRGALAFVRGTGRLFVRFLKWGGSILADAIKASVKNLTQWLTGTSNGRTALLCIVAFAVVAVSPTTAYGLGNWAILFGVVYFGATWFKKAFFGGGGSSKKKKK